jgi:ATP-dependent protease HslVU (ClpYQ) peptidase subunit
MTCIIGLREAGVVHMGGDDEITVEGDMRQRGGGKVVKFSTGLVVGFAGSLATANVLTRPTDGFITSLRDLDNDADVNAAFDRLQDVANFQLKGATDGQFWVMCLVALGPTLVCMGNVAGWSRVQNFRCIGSGSKVATGAMHVANQVKGVTARDRLGYSIGAAAAYVAGVGPMTSYEVTDARPPQQPGASAPPGPAAPSVPPS